MTSEDERRSGVPVAAARSRLRERASLAVTVVVIYAVVAGIFFGLGYAYGRLFQ